MMIYTTIYGVNIDNLISILIVGISIIVFLLLILLFGGLLSNPLKKCYKQLVIANRCLDKILEIIKNEDPKYNSKLDNYIRFTVGKLTKANRLSDAFIYDIGENDEINAASEHITRSINTIILYHKYVFTRPKEDIIKMLEFVKNNLNDGVQEYKELAKHSKNYYQKSFI